MKKTSIQPQSGSVYSYGVSTIFLLIAIAFVGGWLLRAAFDGCAVNTFSQSSPVSRAVPVPGQAQGVSSTQASVAAEQNKNNIDKTAPQADLSDRHIRNSYAAGILVQDMIKRILPAVDLKILEQGLEDRVAERPRMNNDEVKKALENLKEDILALEKADREKKWGAWRQKNVNFLEENKNRPEVKTTDSGLQYKILSPGSGPSGSSGKVVTIKYKVTDIEGNIIDQNSKGISVAPTKMIPGVREALGVLHLNGKAVLWIPYNLAYGETGIANIRPYSTLVFEMELTEIKMD